MNTSRARIERAFRSGEVKLRLWLDEAGAVHRLQLVSRTGNAALDDIIREDLVVAVGAGARSNKATPGRRPAAEKRQVAGTPSKLNHE